MVGDVAGKGMPASLFMAVSIASLQAIMGHNFSPAELLAELDTALVPYTKQQRQNCDMCYAEICRTAEVVGDSCLVTATIRVANAGCITPLIKRADGTIEWVEVGGLPLGTGLGAKFGYEQQELAMSAGDILILMTDGIVLNFTQECGRDE